MLSSETVIISGVDDWTMQWVVSVLVELQMMTTFKMFHSASVCFSSECGGRRTRGRMEKDEKVENGHTLETKLFIHVFADLW